MTVVALARAAELLAEYGGARVVGGLVDVDTRGPARPSRSTPPSRPRVAGVPYTAAQVVELLERGRLRRRRRAATRSPSPRRPWRPDLTDPADLIEEVVRLAGYDDVPSVLPTAPPGRGLTDVQRRRRAVGRTLAEAGYVEAPAYPFVGTAALDALGLPDDDPRRQVIVVRNPLSEEEPALRTTLLPGCSRRWPATSPRPARPRAVRARRGLPGRGAHAGAAARRRPASGRRDAGRAARRRSRAAVARGRGAHRHREPRGWWGPGRPAGWADAVQAARLVAAASGVELTVRAGEQAPWHPGRCAELLVGDRSSATPVSCTRGSARRWSCRHAPRRWSSTSTRCPPAPVPVGPPISAFPPVLIDLALVSATDVPAAEVDAALREGAGELLESLPALRRLHRRAGAGRLALAGLRLTLRAPDRTSPARRPPPVRDAAAAGRRTGAVLRALMPDRAGRAGHRRVHRDRPAPRRGAGRPRDGGGGPGAEPGAGWRRRWPRSPSHRRPHARRGRRRHRPRCGGRRRRRGGRRARPRRPAGQQRRRRRRRRGAAVGGRPRPVVGRRRPATSGAPTSWCAPSCPGCWRAGTAGWSTWPAG